MKYLMFWVRSLLFLNNVLIEVHKLKEGAMPCIHGQMICDAQAQYSIPGAEYTMKNEGHFSDASLADKFFGNLRPPKASCKKVLFTMYWKKGPSLSRRLELKVENDLRSSKHEKMIFYLLWKEKSGRSSVMFFQYGFQFWNFPFSRESIANCIIAKHKKISERKKKNEKKTFHRF